MGARPRVLLADDHADMIDRMKLLLDEDYEIVGEAMTGLDVLRLEPELHPDVLVLDISLPEMSGIEAARMLRSRGSQVKIVIVTVHADPDYVRACMAAGAASYVLKPRMSADLPAAMRDTLAGNSFVSPPLDSETAS